MTEQIEDDFWAAERARDTAARGHHADPSACGTCKASVAAGGRSSTTNARNAQPSYPRRTRPGTSWSPG